MMTEPLWPKRGGNRVIAIQRHRSLLEKYQEIGAATMIPAQAALELGISERHLFRIRAKLRRGEGS